jgi:asparagine synthase (glutamine-hydrolysing)
MADEIAKESGGRAVFVDTISYYDDSEPNWDERPFFMEVEVLRGKRGIHLDTANRVSNYEPIVTTKQYYPYPGADSSSLEAAHLFSNNMGRKGYRVILSGHGGDELLGGVPTPMPALANHLRTRQLLEFTKTASEWCMASRQPLLHMSFNAVRYTASLYRQREPQKTAPPWLHADLRAFCAPQQFPRPPFRGLMHVRPSAIANGDAWWAILASFPHSAPPLVGCYEFRYPYLDRDLVEFLHRIPREQLIKPGRRRYLMRRALKGVVPEVILERKRKAYMSHGPLTRLRNARGKVEHLFDDPLSARYGLVDKDEFLRSLHKELTGELKWLGRISKTIGLEIWLQGLQIYRDNSVNVSESMKSSPVQIRANKIRVANA